MNQDLSRPEPRLFVRLRGLRNVLNFCLFEVAFYFAYRYGMSFSQTAAAPFWFPDSVVLCTLLLAPPRRWWIFILGALPIRLFSEVSQGIPLWFLLTTFAIDSAKGLLMATLLRRFLKNPTRLQTVKEYALFCLFAVGLIPMLGAFAGAAARHALGKDYWTAWEQWFLSNSLTHLVITPLILYWIVGMPWKAPLPSRWRCLEAGLLTIGLVVTGYMAFDVGSESIGMTEPRFYAPVPLLFWAAIRFGMFGACGAVSLIAIFAINAALHGRGPFSGNSPAVTALALQHFLLLRAGPLYLVAVLIKQRRTVEQSLRASEDRYRQVIESQTEMICRYRPDCTLTFVNEAYCRFFNRGRVDLLGVSFLGLVPEESRPAICEAVRRLIEEKRPVTMEHQVLRPDGGVGWMQWNDYPILGDHGEVEELQGVGRDITERRHAEEALRQSEEKFASAFHASPSAISIHQERSGRLLDVNEGWEKLFQIRREDALGRTPVELEFFATARDREGFLRFLLDGRSIRNRELQMRRANGGTCWVSVSCEMIQIGGESCCLSILHEITERKQAEDARQNLAHANRLALVGELTASIAHEINQPLGAILSNAEAAELLLDSPQPALDEVRAILDDIRKNDLRASEVIRRVRALAARRPVEMGPVALDGVIADAVRFVEPDAQRRGVTLVRELAENLPEVQGDRVQIQQALLNLLINGMDAMSDTPLPRRRLVIRSGCNGGRFVEVTVADTGHGIPAEQLPHIFESFFTTKQQGMGLGLALVRSIVELHRGQITVENNMGGGATFRLRLPLESR